MLGAYTLTGGIVTLVGLWSGPGYRDVGVADALLDAVADWASPQRSHRAAAVGARAQ